MTAQKPYSMKRPLLIVSSFLALFCWVLPAHAAISFVNANTSHITSGNAHAVSLSSVTTGNLLYLVISTTVAGTCSTTSTSTPTDNVGNAWLLIASSSAGSSDCAQSWYAANVAGSSTITINVSSTGSTAMAMSINQFSGVATSNPLDASTTKTVVTGSSITSNSYSTTNANDVVIGGGTYTFSNTPAFTAGTTGGTAMTINPSSTLITGGANVNATMEYLVVSNTLTNTTTSINFGTSTIRSDLQVATFKAALTGTGEGLPICSVYNISVRGATIL